MKKTLWIITELFPPEETSTGYIMGEIANAMCAKYEVKVICGPKVYDKNKAQAENANTFINDSIEIFRVNAVSEDRNSKISRIKKFLLMSWHLFLVAKKKINSEDHVLMVTNPFPLIVLMAHLRRKRKIHLSMLAHDIMPESLFTDMRILSPIYKVALSIFNRAYASTDQLISIGRDMTEVLENKCLKYSRRPKISLIENWGDIQNIYPSKEPLETKKIIIQYAGNIGNAQGIDEFVDVMYEANSNDLVFDIWGTGSVEADIKEKVNRYNMEDKVHFHGAYLRSQQQSVLNSCDMALVRLVDGMYGLGVPSKSYNILAAGKPILYIGEKNTEIWRVIKEYGNGVCFEPFDKEGLIKYLRGLSIENRSSLMKMGQISRKLAEEKYSKEVILRKFIDQI